MGTIVRRDARANRSDGTRACGVRAVAEAHWVMMSRGVVRIAFDTAWKVIGGSWASVICCRDAPCKRKLSICETRCMRLIRFLLLTCFN